MGRLSRNAQAKSFTRNALGKALSSQLSPQSRVRYRDELALSARRVDTANKPGWLGCTRTTVTCWLGKRPTGSQPSALLPVRNNVGPLPTYHMFGWKASAARAAQAVLGTSSTWSQTL